MTAIRSWIDDVAGGWVILFCIFVGIPVILWFVLGYFVTGYYPCPQLPEEKVVIYQKWIPNNDLIDWPPPGCDELGATCCELMINGGYPLCNENGFCLVDGCYNPGEATRALPDTPEEL